MAAARISEPGHTPRWHSAVAWSALSLLPDVDVSGFVLGVDYSDPWGHRGATHSLTMTAALGLAIGLIARWRGRPSIRTGALATAVVASHGLLDAMTDGGLGCALLWAFDLTRYFAAWRPIPVVPIGAGYFSAYGAMVALTEFVLFAPVFLVSLGYRRIAARPVRSALRAARTGLAVHLEQRRRTPPHENRGVYTRAGVDSDTAMALADCRDALGKRVWTASPRYSRAARAAKSS